MWIKKVALLPAMRLSLKQLPLLLPQKMPQPLLHPNCRYQIRPMEAVIAGNATKDGNNSADWWLKYLGVLPDYYITEEEANKQGYRSYLGNLGQVAPGKMLTKGVYGNRNGHLPTMSGRVWYEADINYNRRYRNSERILFSNDGLIFITYDHYKTCEEIV